jgi:hypothetical protein
VTLDLVGCGCNAGAINECLQMLLGVVRYTNSASLLLWQLSHRLPGVDDGYIIQHLDVAIRLVRLLLHGEQVVVWVGALIECDGEVHEVQV